MYLHSPPPVAEVQVLLTIAYLRQGMRRAGTAWTVHCWTPAWPCVVCAWRDAGRSETARAFPLLVASRPSLYVDNDRRTARMRTLSARSEAWWQVPSSSVAHPKRSVSLTVTLYCCVLSRWRCRRGVQCEDGTVHTALPFASRRVAKTGRRVGRLFARITCGRSR